MLPHIPMFKWSCEFTTLGHHTTSFGGFKHCGRGDKTFSISHLILIDDMFKVLSDFIGGSSLW